MKTYNAMHQLHHPEPRRGEGSKNQILRSAFGLPQNDSESAWVPQNDTRPIFHNPLLRIFLILTLIAVFATGALAETKKVTFVSPLVWRADGAGTYALKDIHVTGGSVASDGSVVSSNSIATCEPTSAYQTDGMAYSITLNWTFTGKVTMEVTATGNTKDYVAVTSGVPLEYVNFTAGTNLKWRATLGPNSTLSEVRLTYSDLSGVMGSFGNPLLSGFPVRKPVYIKGSEAGELYNYQIPILVGEGAKTAGCDATLSGGMKADFNDIRFTQADGQTTLPYYLDGITGKSPDQVAKFWVKIPQIPKDGLPIYMYYGAPGAASLSNGEKVFDFFEHFDGSDIDIKKWNIIPDSKTATASVLASSLTLDSARAYTKDYKFDYGVIEYKARLSGTGAIVGIMNAGASSDSDLAAYSSTAPATAHCIVTGVIVKANDQKPISLGTDYYYTIVRGASGDITFRRYGEESSTTPQAEVKSTVSGSNASSIGLSPGNLGQGATYEYIRTRKYAEAVPQVDIARTLSAVPEAVNLSEFSNVVTTAGGDLILADKATAGYYISKLITPPFIARIIKPMWDAQTPGSGSLALCVSTQEGGDFYTGWQNSAPLYASRKDFIQGKQIKWKMDFNGPDLKESPTVRRLTLELQSGTIRVVLPNGGEAIDPGAKYSVSWEAPGYGTDYPMDIAYTLDNGKTYTPIATKTTNGTGSYTWIVPNENMENVKVRVTDSNDMVVYGMSSEPFTIGVSASTALKTAESVVGTTTAETTAAAEKASEAAKAAEDLAEDNDNATGKLYELLLVKNDIESGDKVGKLLYRQGDIIMIQPAGFLWGAAERRDFRIVRVHLTDEEATKLMKPDEITSGTDSTGAPNRKILKQRRYRIDLTKKGILGKKVAAMKGLSLDVPVINRMGIVDKNTEK